MSRMMSKYMNLLDQKFGCLSRLGEAAGALNIYPRGGGEWRVHLHNAHFKSGLYLRWNPNGKITVGLCRHDCSLA